MPFQEKSLQFSHIYVFGDSLSDNGNRAHLQRATRWYYRVYRWVYRRAYPQLQTAFVGDRHSDGPVAIEEIARQFELDVKPAWKDADGTNYAVSGARAAGSNYVPTLAAQLQKFLETRPDDEPLPSDALYVVYIGGNDVLDASKRSQRTAEGHIKWAVKGVEWCIRQLEYRGAKCFLVPSRGDIGNTPKLSGRWRGPDRARRATRLSLYFNLLLAARLDRVESSIDITVIRFDGFEFGRTLRDRAEAYGWANLTGSCRMARRRCDLDRFFFFDGFHPTAKRHRVNGEALSQAIREAIS